MFMIRSFVKGDLAFAVPGSGVRYNPAFAQKYWPTFVRALSSLGAGQALMILTSYIDEAGTHAGSGVTVMGGYLARLGQWRHFDEKWRRLLKHYDLTHMHTVEMLQAKGQFHRGWDQHRAMELLLKSDKIINKHTMFGISAFVGDDDYKNIYAKEPRPKKIPLDTRYGLCFRLMVIFIVRKAAEEERRDDLCINFVLESGAKNAGDARRIFNLFKKEAPQRDMLGTLSFGNKKDFPGLQAADSIASPVFQFEKKPPDKPIYFPENVADEALALGRKRVDGKTPVYRLEATEKILSELRSSIDDTIEARRQFGQRRRNSNVAISRPRVDSVS
jgi:hypothetical protein